MSPGLSKNIYSPISKTEESNWNSAWTEESLIIADLIREDLNVNLLHNAQHNSISPSNYYSVFAILITCRVFLFPP